MDVSFERLLRRTPIPESVRHGRAHLDFQITDIRQTQFRPPRLDCVLNTPPVQVLQAACYNEKGVKKYEQCLVLPEDAPANLISTALQDECAAIQLIGCTASGASVAVNLSGFLPYFYVEVPRWFSEEHLPYLRDYVEGHLRGRYDGSTWQWKPWKRPRGSHVLQMQLVTHRKNLELGRTQTDRFVKIVLLRPSFVAPLREWFHAPSGAASNHLFAPFDFVKELDRLGIVEANAEAEWMHHWRTFESNINFEVRYIVDCQLTGSSWVRIPAGMFVARRPHGEESDDDDEPQKSKKRPAKRPTSAFTQRKRTKMYDDDDGGVGFDVLADAMDDDDDDDDDGADYMDEEPDNDDDEAEQQEQQRLAPLTRQDLEVDANFACVLVDDGNSSIAPARKVTWDIETARRADYHRGPDPTDPGCPVVSISAVVTHVSTSDAQRSDQSSPLRNQEYCWLLSRTCAPLRSKNAVLRLCIDEEGMIDDFFSFLKACNAEYSSGHSIINYDMPYLFTRADLLGLQDYAKFGKVLNQPVKLEKNRSGPKGSGLAKLSRSKEAAAARKKTKGVYKADVAAAAAKATKAKETKPDPMREDYVLRWPGVIVADILPIIQDVLKKSLRSYTLNTMSKNYLNDTKFEMAYWRIGKITFEGTDEERRDLVEYNLKDCWLPDGIMRKLFIVPWLVGMSRVTRLPIDMILKRGETLKVFSLVWYFSRVGVLEMDGVTRSWYLVPYVHGKQDNATYQGAELIPPKKAYYGWPISTLDFESLYGNQIIERNICYCTFIPPQMLHLYTPDQYEITPSVGHAFLKREVRRGVLPSIELHVQACRSRKKGELKATNTLKNAVSDIVSTFSTSSSSSASTSTSSSASTIKTETEWHRRALAHVSEQCGKTIHTLADYAQAVSDLDAYAEALDQEQLSNKLVGNLVYGATGTAGSTLPLKALAEAITAYGRMMLNEAFEVVNNNFGKSNGHENDPVVIYGDSVSAITPIFWRRAGSVDVHMCPAEDLAQDVAGGPNRRVHWQSYHAEGDKECVVLSGAAIQVWSDQNWTDVYRIIRHRTDKMMLRVVTGSGCVEVTQDHSLLDEHAQKISPENVRVGMPLLHHTTPPCASQSDDWRLTLAADVAYVWGAFCASGYCTEHTTERSWCVCTRSATGALRILRAMAICEPLVSFAAVLEGTHLVVRAMKSAEMDGTQKLAKRWRHMFYTTSSLRQVPDAILNATKHTRRLFVDGLMEGTLGEELVLVDQQVDLTTTRGSLQAAGLFAVVQSVLPRSTEQRVVQLTAPDTNRDTYTLRWSWNTTDAVPTSAATVRRVERLGSTRDYVYDLETSNHHFAAGVGRLVVHNTDSVMIFWGEHVVLREHSFRLAFEAVSIINARYKGMRADTRVNLQVEKVYDPYFLPSNKRYGACKFLYASGDKWSEESAKIIRYGPEAKGLETVRRDNAKLCQTSVAGVIDIMIQDTQEERVVKRMQNLLANGRLETAQSLQKDLDRWYPAYGIRFDPDTRRLSGRLVPAEPAPGFRRLARPSDPPVAVLPPPRTRASGTKQTTLTSMFAPTQQSAPAPVPDAAPKVSEATVNKLIDYITAQMTELYSQRIDMSKLVVAKGITREVEDYEVKQGHVVLAKKIMARDPHATIGNRSRISYMVCKGSKGEGMSQRCEQPSKVLDKGLSIDIEYYAEAARTAITKLAKLVVPEEKLRHAFEGPHTRVSKAQIFERQDHALTGGPSVMKLLRQSDDRAQTLPRCISCRCVILDEDQDPTAAVCQACKENGSVGKLLVETEVALRSVKLESEQYWAECRRCVKGGNERECSNFDCDNFFVRTQRQIELDLVAKKHGALLGAAMNW